MMNKKREIGSVATTVADYPLKMMNKKSRVMSATPSSYLFSLLPEDLVIHEILLKLPVSSLLRLRYVSRYFHRLITCQSFVKKHLDQSSSMINHELLLITCKYILPRINPITGQLSTGIEDVFEHFSCDFSGVDNPLLPDVVEMSFPFEAGIHGSSNGLLFLHGTTKDTKEHGYIWNPCTKEYKQLPAPPVIEDGNQHLFGGIEVVSRSKPRSGFCGFGYDRINDEYKILYHENIVGHLPDEVNRSIENFVSVTEFKLYTLGSNRWKNITDNPYRSLFFKNSMRRIGLFVNGAFHWIMTSTMTSPISPSSSKNAKIISFDIEKEEFREVQKPPQYYFTRSSLEEVEYYCGELQVLQECLCLCLAPDPYIKETIDIWILKDYMVKDSWTKLFTIVVPNGLLDMRYLQLLRSRESSEILVLRDGRKQLNMYNPVNHHISRIVDENIVDSEWVHEVIYKESLVSLNSGTYIV